MRLTSSFLKYFLLLLLAFAFRINGAQAQSSTGESETSEPSFRFGGFLQQQFTADQTSGSPARFSIHRARFGVVGTVTDRIKINLVGGFVEPPDDTPHLVNAFIDFDIHSLLQVRAGQFLLPFGLEGPQPIPFNPAIERSTAIRRLNTFTMFRDIGIRLSGRHSFFSYAVALVNGAGANRPETTEFKDLLGRLAVAPIRNLEVGFSGHLGHYQPDPLSTETESRYRTGADVSYSGDPVFLRGEYMVRRDEQPGGGSRNMNGGYLLIGWRISEELETIGRFEDYDPDTSSSDDHLAALTLGANYYFEGNTRLSVNYEFRNDRLNPGLGNLLTIQMQVTL